jgi:hypothetical protein
MKRADFEDAWQEAMVEASKLPDAKKRYGGTSTFQSRSRN